MLLLMNRSEQKLLNKNGLKGFKLRCIYILNILNILSKKMLGCFNPKLGQIWTNTNVGL